MVAGTVSSSDPIIRLDCQRLREQIGCRRKPTRASQLSQPVTVKQATFMWISLCIPRSWRLGGWLGLGPREAHKRALSQRFDEGKLGMRNRLRLADIQRGLYGPVGTRQQTLVFYQIEARAKGAVLGRFVYAGSCRTDPAAIK